MGDWEWLPSFLDYRCFGNVPDSVELPISFLVSCCVLREFIAASGFYRHTSSLWKDVFLRHFTLFAPHHTVHNLCLFVSCLKLKVKFHSTPFSNFRVKHVC